MSVKELGEVGGPGVGGSCLRSLPAVFEIGSELFESGDRARDFSDAQECNRGLIGRRVRLSEGEHGRVGAIGKRWIGAGVRHQLGHHFAGDSVHVLR